MQYLWENIILQKGTNIYPFAINNLDFLSNSFMGEKSSLEGDIWDMS